MAIEVDAERTPSGEEPRGWGGVLRRITRFEVVTAAIVAAIMVVLVLVEPEVLEAPFENARTVVFTFGGGAVLALAYLAMLRLRVPPAVRVLVVGVPFVAVTYWLVEPYFVDDEVHEDFVTSIEEASGPQATVPAAPAPDPEPTSDTTTATVPAVPSQPVLLGSGTFRGLAGHDGTGDAGFFALPEGGHVLRLENFDIDNGPDLRLYVVPGADQTDPTDGSLYLGELRGNVGDQTYELPDDFVPSPGPWTVLVWCEAFSVEFVAATITVG